MARFDDQTELIRALFAAAVDVEREPWSDFLTELQSVTQAEGASFALDGEGVYGAGPSIEGELRERLRVDRVYDQESLPNYEWRHGFLRAVRVRVDSAHSAILWITRGVHQRDFRSADGQLLSAMVPFLAQAVEMSQAQGRLKKQAAFSERLAHEAGQGWLLFERTGELADLSQAARAWSDKQGLRLVERRFLELPDADAAQSFRNAFQSVLNGAARAVARLGEDPLSEMVLTPSGTAPNFLVLASLRQMPLATDISAEIFAAHFGLSRSEARLAQHLCDGKSLKDAARILGWTEETARSTSKAIFARVGVWASQHWSAV